MTAARVAFALAAIGATGACTFDKNLGDTVESVEPDPDLDLDAALFSGCSTDGVEVVAEGQRYVQFFLLDPNNVTVYWSMPNDGVVMRTSRSEADAAFVEPAGFAYSASPQQLTQDVENVYWTEEQQGVIGYASKSGGATSFLEVDLVKPSSITADDTHIYWSHSDNGIVYRRAIGGAAREVVAMDQGRMGPRIFAQDDNHLYWVRSEAETIMHLEKAGGAPEVFASDTGPIGAIAIDGEHVYWTRHSGGSLEDSIWRKPRDGSTSPVPIALHLVSAGALAVDEQHVYFQNVGSVMRVDKAGGEPELVHENYPFNNVFTGGGDIQLDEDYVYWSQAKCDAIFRIAKSDLN